MDAYPARHALTRAHVPFQPAHEVKFMPLEMKSVDADGTFEGYASVFHREDFSGDVVMPGAFSESIRRRGPSNIKLLYQHDVHQPIGVWTSLEEDSRGLFAKGRLTREVERAREVHALMKAGALDGLSIGFRTVKSRRDRMSNLRRLEKVDLWEISIVTFPLLPEARIATVKARPFAGATPTEREFERWLTRDAGLTRTEARAVLRAGFQGLKAQGHAGRHGHKCMSEDVRLAHRILAAARWMS